MPAIKNLIIMDQGWNLTKFLLFLSSDVTLKLRLSIELSLSKFFIELAVVFPIEFEKDLFAV